MSTLAEIEAATEQLTEAQKEELLLFLTERLDQGRPSPAESAVKGDYPRLGTSPVTGFPLIICTPGNVINPTAEQLGEI